MSHFFKLSSTLLLLFILPWPAVSEAGQPYCYENVTETSYKLVTKTRLINVKSKNFFKKITFKKDTEIEVYEDREPVYKTRLVRTCCEGYKLNEFDLCEPQCVESCPRHSKCVEPEVCECLKGYFSTGSAVDGKHYCAPVCEISCPEHSVCVAINACVCNKGYHVMDDMQCKPYCASGCPYNGVCVKPNLCSCPEGYKSENGSCLPICSLGDQCLNGKCVDKDHCICNYGFKWNSETFKCDYNDRESTTYSPDNAQSKSATGSSEEVDTEDNIDPSQMFEANTETTAFYITDEYGSSTVDSLEVKRKCPDNFVFHKGQCRPLKFVSNEIDCWLKPCRDKHAVCLKNGTCACTEGFETYKSHVGDHNSLNGTIETVCLSAAESEARIRHLERDPKKYVPEEERSWTLIFFVVLGVFAIISALAVLGLKLFWRHTGQVDVEAKNLACAYNSRGCSPTDKPIP